MRVLGFVVASCLAVLSLGFAPLAGARTVLTQANLTSPTYSYSRVDLGAYLPDAGATAPTNTFQGTLSFSVGSGAFSYERYNAAGAVSNSYCNTTYLSAAQCSSATSFPTDFSFKFVQTGVLADGNTYLVPEKRGANTSSHAFWEVVLEPGRVWNEAGDGAYSRAAIPFALVQKNANCTFNGVATFLFKNDGTTSNVALQLSSETCFYLKQSMWGLMKTHTYTPATVTGAATLISNFTTERASRLPVYPLSQLVTDYTRTDGSAVVPGNFAIGGASHRTVYGFVIDGKNYRSDCATRNGNYPYCDVLTLPSYSTAKTVVGAAGLMRLEQLYPNARLSVVKTYATQCTTGWTTENFENALDMTVNNYNSATYDWLAGSDEGSTKMGTFFTATTHAAKMSSACTWTDHGSPGATWVYHSSDSYILGAAMNAYLKAQPGRASDDIYTNLLYNDLWTPLHLSGNMAYTRRTYDTTAQAFTAFGLYYHSDDIARIAAFLNDSNGVLGGTQVLKQTMLDAGLQRNPSDIGKQLTGTYSYIRYNNGFWASNVGSAAGCPADKWLPYMSGFGGISVLLIPNHTVYYSFADDGTTDWTTAAVEANRIRGYC